MYDIEAPSGWILKQIKDYKEQFGYTYRGIKSTLYYFYEVKDGTSVEDSTGIGIVPFVYEEAKRFFIDKKAVKDSLKECDVNLIQEQCEIIHVKKAPSTHNTFKDNELIDISEL